MLLVLSVVIVLCSWAFPGHVVGQGTIGFGNKRSELIAANEEDIEFVQCQFCKLAAKHLHRSVVMMKTAMPSWVKKLPEEALDAFLDRVCNSNQETGEWLTKMDVQQEGDALVIKQMQDVRSQPVCCHCTFQGCVPHWVCSGRANASLGQCAPISVVLLNTDLAHVTAYAMLSAI